MKKNYKLFSVGLIAVAINSTKAQCPVPSLVIASPSTICAGSTTSLNATAVGASINWFTVPVGGVAIGSSASAANFTISPATTTTYYAESMSISSTTTNTFAYTGGVQVFTVPAGVTSLTIDARGAQGGGDLTCIGGLGGRLQSVLTVTPGQVFNIYVGGAGVYASGAAGYNGGGTGIGGNGGGGGGASDIRFGGVALVNRILVAGAGGGATSNGGTANGGAGGGLIGATGFGNNAWSCTAFVFATGGSQVAGGVGGTSTSCLWNGFNGTLGIGGNSYTTYASGGGGGGYYGGGGGHNGMSGAGGSNYAVPTASSVVHTQGFQTGNGAIYILYNPICTSASRTSVTVTVNSVPTISVTSGAICAGNSYTMVASGAGTYTYTGGSAVVTPTTNTSYSVTGTSSLGCAASNTAVSSVTVNANPSVVASTSNSVICSGGSAVLSASTSATSYTWNTGATTMSVSVSPTITSTYTVNVSNAAACVASSTVMVTVNACVGINEAVANLISVYPNPNNGVLNISLIAELSKNASLEICDALGKLIIKQVLVNEINAINISHLNNGIYTYKVLNNTNTIKIGKIVKQ